MVSLEQVKLLESKVTKTIEFVKKITGENARLKEKLDSYQKRIDGLEVLIQRFKEDQNSIEDGILSALDRLNQFEDALENTVFLEPLSPKESAPPEENALLPEGDPSPEVKKDTAEIKPVSKKDNPPAEKKPPVQVEKDESAGNTDSPSGAELDIF